MSTTDQPAAGRATAIDVLLPFYGDPALMRLAVESIREQTDGDWRLVVLDDAYPDPTIEPWFAALGDDRVEYHRNAVNLGANGNYVRALELARSDYVVIMGADDLMLPGYLTTIRRALQAAPGTGVVQPGVKVIDEHGGMVSPLGDRIKRRLMPRTTAPTELGGEDVMSSLLRGNWTYFPSLCWRREAIIAIGFRPQFNVVQDLALLIDLLRAGHTLTVSPEPAFRYRRHGGSDSAIKTIGGARFDEELAYYRTIAAELSAEGRHRAARAARRHITSRLHAGMLVPAALAQRDWPAARRLVRHAFLTG